MPERDAIEDAIADAPPGAPGAGTVQAAMLGRMEVAARRGSHRGQMAPSWDAQPPPPKHGRRASPRAERKTELFKMLDAY